MFTSTYWRHFFLDIPLSTFGISSAKNRAISFYNFEKTSYRNGILHLFPNASSEQIHQYIESAINYKILKEQEAFRCLWQFSSIERSEITGLNHLTTAPKDKPVIILTGHYGSFYTLATVLATKNIEVYPIARTVEKSNLNPLAQQYFEQFNYWSTQRRLKSHYLFTDFNGWMDKRIIDVMKTNKAILLSIDLPKQLFPHGRTSIQFLHGKMSSFPSGMVRLAQKRKATFLTAWHEFTITGQRRLIIDAPIDNQTTETILQTYANRLQEKIMQHPWQWLGLPIVSQYME